jgi:hypothetical protein
MKEIDTIAKINPVRVQNSDRVLGDVFINKTLYL